MENTISADVCEQLTALSMLIDTCVNNSSASYEIMQSLKMLENSKLRSAFDVLSSSCFAMSALMSQLRKELDF